MFGSLKESVGDLTNRVAELYKELVTNTVQFQELRSYTKETLSEYKHLLERLNDKLEESEKNRIKTETDLLSKINALEGRLNALSEQALHAAAKEAATQFYNQVLSEKKQQNSFLNKKMDEIKELPDQPN